MVEEPGEDHANHPDQNMDDAKSDSSLGGIIVHFCCHDARRSNYNCVMRKMVVRPAQGETGFKKICRQCRVRETGFNR